MKRTSTIPFKSIFASVHVHPLNVVSYKPFTSKHFVPDVCLDGFLWMPIWIWIKQRKKRARRLNFGNFGVWCVCSALPILLDKMAHLAEWEWIYIEIHCILKRIKLFLEPMNKIYIFYWTMNIFLTTLDENKEMKRKTMCWSLINFLIRRYHRFILNGLFNVCNLI